MLLRISDLVHMGHYVLAPTYYKLYQALIFTDRRYALHAQKSQRL